MPNVEVSMTEATPLTTRKRKSQPDPTEEFLKLACAKLQEPPCEDFHLASAWAKELGAMTPDQKILAKKFINDVIFEGQMGTLTRNSVKINEPEYIYYTNDEQK